jgi:deoxyribonuclease V
MVRVRLKGDITEMTPARARAIQSRLAGRVAIRPFTRKEYLAAGTDVSFDDENKRAAAGVVVVRFPGLETVEEAWAEAVLDFPYIPGLLSFREIPSLLGAFKRLKGKPDCVIADGQGLAHPRRFGLACHLGFLLEIPTLGCAKSRLIGEHSEPGCRRGSQTPLTIGDETVGAALRTRDGVSPVYVSPGHLMDIDSAVRIALECSVTRIPEPTRRAHLLVTRVMRERAH